jgi:L-ascorbate metabolism protein UlaG (beta-lactamase superfamily)
LTLHIEESLVRLARMPGQTHERDHAAVAELAWSAAASPVALPPGVELEWLGTAGFRLSAGGTTLLIDPYVSRPGLRHVLSRSPLLPSADVVATHLPERADAILVGHTHFDHALDVPAIARRDGCPVYGSSSLVRLMDLHGLGPKSVAVVPYRRYEVGPFVVSFVPSRHSRLVAGLRVPADGELTCDHLDHLTGRAYRCGDVWGISIEVEGLRLYHQGSADLVDDEKLPRDVDIFLCGIAGRAFAPRYLRRILPRLEPRVVVPHHWDDFFRPLDGPLGFSLNVRLHRLPAEVAAVSSEFAIRTLRPREPVSGSA